MGYKGLLSYHCISRDDVKFILEEDNTLQKTRLISIFLVFLLLVSFLQFPQMQTYAITPYTFEAQQRTSNAVVLYIGSPQAYVYNVVKPIDDTNKEVKPFLKNSKTLVPVGFIAQSFGASVDWDAKTRTVTVKQGSYSVKLALGSKKIYINNVEKALEIPAESINGRTYIPLRDLVEALNKKVFYDKGLIIISDQENIVDKNTEADLVNEITSWFTGQQSSAVVNKPSVTEPDSLGTLSIKDIAAFDESVVSIITINSLGDEAGQGSGFYIGEGLFVTNHHVIKDGVTFKIITNQNVELSVAGIVKQDKVHDLAILKSKSLPDLKPLKIGSKDMVVKGDTIVTIGNPEGLQNTVSDGIVSGFRRVDNTDYIQITAPITYGSSGGPLFDMKGYVIGVNTAGLDAGNLNFAVAIDNIKDWINELKSKSFKDIVAVDAAKLKEAEKGTAREQVRSFIEDMFKALNAEDINAYKSVYHDARLAENAGDSMAWQFKTYDLEFKLENIDVTSFGTSTADVIVTYTIKKLKGPVFRDARMTGNYRIWNMSGQWRIMDITSSIKEYLDIPASQTNTIEEQPTTQTQSGTTDSTSATIKSGSDLLDLVVTDAIMHPTKPLLYITDKSHKKLYEYNVDTNKYVRQISFGLEPESIDFANNEIYVGLLKKAHDPQVYTKDQAGAIAIIDPGTFEVTEQLDINLDPFDIVIDKEGYIYVTSGSGQHTQIKSYFRKTKQEIDSTGISHKSYALLNPVLNRIYTITTASFPRDMWAFNINSGKFVEKGLSGGYDSPYHGDYAMGENFKISPDGKYIFNGAGTIFACGGTAATDMNYVSKLNKKFLDIAFNEGDGLFYTSIEGKFIYVYDYKTFEGVNSYTLDSNAERLFYRNGELIAICKDGDKYSIKTIDVKN